MSKRKRSSKKKLAGKGRLKDAKNWLSCSHQKELISSYCKRYGVSSYVAEEELMQLGYYDELCIERYEKEGIEWEYKYDGYSGEMYVVPKGTDDYEMYEIHGDLFPFKS